MRGLFGFFKKTTKPQLVQSSAGGNPRQNKIRRVFNAARVDRLADDWKINTTSINEDIKTAIGKLRARARDLEQNNEIARRFLKLVETHVVGSRGFRLQVAGKLRNGNPDENVNKIIELAFLDWAQRDSCEITGRMSLVDVERLQIRTAARDGELLIRTYESAPTPENPYGFTLEILDPARIDTQKEINLSNGNKVRLGIEIDERTRPVAYWLYSGEIKNNFGQKGERVPAENIIHAFISDRPEQLRGVPWMTGVMFAIHMLSAYQEAAVTAARIGAAKMGFYKTPDGSFDALADGEEAGEFLTDAEPGHFSPLPPGYEFEQFNPDYPHQMYAEFTSTVKRDISSGLCVSYHALSGDLTDVNFSSIRSGTLEERENWMVLQDWFSGSVLNPIYRRWLKRALAVGVISTPLSNTEAYARYRRHTWQGRRWPWVDPKKDIETAVTAINARLKSPQMVADEMGVDSEKVIDEIARFEKMADEKGVSLTQET